MPKLNLAGMPEVPRISRKKPTARNDDGPPEKSNRGDRTPLELFLVGIRGWEGALRRRLNDSKSKED
jgi:hypothetical protein